MTNRYQLGSGSEYVVADNAAEARQKAVYAVVPGFSVKVSGPSGYWTVEHDHRFSGRNGWTYTAGNGTVRKPVFPPLAPRKGTCHGETGWEGLYVDEGVGLVEIVRINYRENYGDPMLVGIVRLTEYDGDGFRNTIEIGYDEYTVLKDFERYLDGRLGGIVIVSSDSRYGRVMKMVVAGVTDPEELMGPRSDSARSSRLSSRKSGNRHSARFGRVRR